MRKKLYSDEFKQNIVTLYNQGVSVNSLHQNHNISASAIYRWIQEFSMEDNKDNLTLDITELQQENIKLKEKVRALKYAVNALAKV